MNENSNALMVVITLIYVIATIVICVANTKSANISKDQLIASDKQLQEIKRQYEETKRLSMMPYIAFDTETGMAEQKVTLKLSTGERNIRGCFVDRNIKNIGSGTAKDIVFTWKGFSETESEIVFPIINLQSGDNKNIKFHFVESEEHFDKLIACGRFTYQDLLENSYYQDVCFFFERNGNEIKCTGHGIEKPELITKE